MNDCGFIRARTSDQIETRRGEILQAAAELVMEEGFDKVSLNGIARRAGIAKSNLYRYFEGKEEIFFEVMFQDYSDWIEDLTARLKALPNPASDEEATRALVYSLEGRDRLCHFISIKASVFEKNMTEEARAQFTKAMLTRAEGIITALCEKLPHLCPGDAIQLLKSTNALAAGFWPMSQHSFPQDAPHFDKWQTKFLLDLEKSVYLILLGLRDQAN